MASRLGKPSWKRHDEVIMNWRSRWTVAATLATLLLAACGGASEAEKYFDAGVELQGQGRLEEAIVQYDEAIRLDPQLGPGLHEPRPRLRNHGPASAGRAGL